MEISQEKIKDYAMTAVLGAVSLPVAGFYLGRKKGNKLTNTLLGIGLSALISAGTLMCYKATINSYDRGDIQIEHTYYHPSEKDAPMNNMPWLKEKALVAGATFLCSTTNFVPVLFALENSENRYTKVTINGNDDKDKVTGIYYLNDFVNPSNIRNMSLPPHPYELKVNNSEIRGKLGKETYDGLCRKIFEYEMNNFNQTN